MPSAKPATVRISAVTMRDMAVTRVTCPSPFGLVTLHHDVTVEAEAEADTEAYNTKVKVNYQIGRYATV